MTPTPYQLTAVVADLSSRQQDGLPVQPHPGDPERHWRFGSVALAKAIRVWTAHGAMVAIGIVDQSSLVRLALAPSAEHDAELAQAVVRDLQDPTRGILHGAKLIVEARFGTALRSLLRADGWVADDPWTPLVRDLSNPVEDCALQVETVGPNRVEDRVEVQRAAFDRSTFSSALWDQMSHAPAYRRGRCLVGYDDRDHAVAAVTVWSAGPGRPGLLEPMGVHRDHRGLGYGTAMSLAAAAALREMGASSALVATPSTNVGGVATYASAGFRPLPDVTDFAYLRRAVTGSSG